MLFKQWNDKILKYDHNNIEQCSSSVQQLLHSASLVLHAAEQCRRNFLHLHRALIHLGAAAADQFQTVVWDWRK